MYLYIYFHTYSYIYVVMYFYIYIYIYAYLLGHHWPESFLCWCFFKSNDLLLSTQLLRRIFRSSPDHLARQNGRGTNAIQMSPRQIGESPARSPHGPVRRSPFGLRQTGGDITVPLPSTVFLRLRWVPWLPPPLRLELNRDRKGLLKNRKS